MPRALIVFESMFGNGHRVADLVADGLRDAEWDVETVCVLEAPESPRAELIVLGAPTHALGLSRPATRATRTSHVSSEADRRKVEAEPGADSGRGMREYLGAVRLPEGQPVGVYDTRGSRSPVGGASRAMARRLAAAGARVLTPARRFVVEGFTGPLADGEEERAREWAATLASTYAERVVSPLSPSRP